MKRAAHILRPTTLRFKRWSRKAYAAFISIRCAVTIGHLSANVSERFQTKNGSTHTSVLLLGTATDDGEEVSDTDLPTGLLQPAIQLLQVPAFLFIQPTLRPVAAAPAYLVTNYSSERAESFSHRLELSALFSFILTNNRYD